MKTKDILNQPSNHNAMKTILISIPAIAIPHVMETLRKNDIQSKYMGLDQSHKLIMQVIHTESHAVLLKDLSDFITQCEGFVSELEQAIRKYLEERKLQHAPVTV